MALPRPGQPLPTPEQMRAYAERIDKQPFSLFGRFPIFPEARGEATSITVTMWLPPDCPPGDITNRGDTPMTVFGSGTKIVLEPGERCVWPVLTKDKDA